MSAQAVTGAKVPWLLVVDDDPVAARALSRLLTAQTGARVAVVHNVDDALRLVMRAAEAPAAAVLDFELPRGETGVSLLMSLRASGSEVPCVFHTGAPSRAASALEASRLGPGYAVFEKGRNTADLLAWAQGVVVSADLRRRSGTRRRVVTS